MRRGGRSAAVLGSMLVLASCGLNSHQDSLGGPPAAARLGPEPVATSAPGAAGSSAPAAPPAAAPAAPAARPTAAPTRGRLAPAPQRPATRPGDGRFALPSHGSDSGPAALLEAARFASSAAGCVWLVDRQGQRRAVLFPPRWTAALSPLRLYDAGGREVWREPRVLDVGGGSSPVHVDRIPAACRTGSSAWWLMPFEPA